MPNYDPDQLLSRKELARILKFSPGTLAVWDCTKRYNLNPIKIGEAVRYRRADVSKLIEMFNNLKRPKAKR